MPRSLTSLYMHLGRFLGKQYICRSGRKAFTPELRLSQKLKTRATPIVITTGFACNYSFMDAALAAQSLRFEFVTLLGASQKLLLHATIIVITMRVPYDQHDQSFMDAALATESPLKSARSGLDKPKKVNNQNLPRYDNEVCYLDYLITEVIIDSDQRLGGDFFFN